MTPSRHAAVSVCIPAYNHPDLLQRCLESIAYQDFTDFEVIVTDDSTTEGVRDLCKRITIGGRLQYFRNAHRLGTPENWNEGLRRANGTFLKLLHHDDWLATPQSLGRLVALLADDPQADFGFCATTACLAPGQIQFHHRPSAGELRRLARDPRCLVFGNFIGAPSVTIHRRNVPMVYDSRLQWHVDTDAYLQILCRNPRFRFSPDELVCTYVGGGSQVTAGCLANPDVELPELGILWRKWFPRGEGEAAGWRAILFWSRLLARLGIPPWGPALQLTGPVRVAGRVKRGVRLLYPWFHRLTQGLSGRGRLVGKRWDCCEDSSGVR